MRELSSAEVASIVEEVRSILREIVGQDSYSTVSVGVKRGGYSATCDPKAQRIEVRANVWRKLTLFGRRVILCHECLHLRGWDHSGVKMYCAGADLASLALYRAIWGDDPESGAAWTVCRDRVRASFPEHFKGVQS